MPLRCFPDPPVLEVRSTCKGAGWEGDGRHCKLLSGIALRTSGDCLFAAGPNQNSSLFRPRVIVFRDRAGPHGLLRWTPLGAKCVPRGGGG
jgi:hypothetical protein